jgi:hypothetical protein
MMLYLSKLILMELLLAEVAGADDLRWYLLRLLLVSVELYCLLLPGAFQVVLLLLSQPGLQLPYHDLRCGPCGMRKLRVYNDYKSLWQQGYIH